MGRGSSTGSSLSVTGRQRGSEPVSGHKRFSSSRGTGNVIGTGDGGDGDDDEDFFPRYGGDYDAAAFIEACGFDPFGPL